MLCAYTNWQTQVLIYEKLIYRYVYLAAIAS